jgi:hypothetical protein
MASPQGRVECPSEQSESKGAVILVSSTQHFRTPAWCRIVRHREESHGEREI